MTKNKQCTDKLCEKDGKCYYRNDIEKLLNNINQHFRELDSMKSNGTNIKDLFLERGSLMSGLKQYIESLEQSNDFKGIYVFVSKGCPKYVGISRNVINRLKQHVTGKDMNHAGFANRIILKKYPLENRSVNKTEHFKRHREDAQKKILKMRLLVKEVNCDYELYMLEVYAAFRWGCEHNTFRTH